MPEPRLPPGLGADAARKIGAPRRLNTPRTETVAMRVAGPKAGPSVGEPPLNPSTIMSVTTRLAFTVHSAAEGPERLATPSLSQFEKRLSIRVDTQPGLG
jgi:hypothetical protein